MKNLPYYNFFFFVKKATSRQILFRNGKTSGTKREENTNPYSILFCYFYDEIKTYLLQGTISAHPKKKPFSQSLPFMSYILMA